MTVRRVVWVILAGLLLISLFRAGSASSWASGYEAGFQAVAQEQAAAETVAGATDDETVQADSFGPGPRYRYGYGWYGYRPFFWAGIFFKFGFFIIVLLLLSRRFSFGHWGGGWHHHRDGVLNDEDRDRADDDEPDRATMI